MDETHTNSRKKVQKRARLQLLGAGHIPGDDLLSQDLSSQYHRRCSVSLPGSEWDRVVPLRSGHQRLISVVARLLLELGLWGSELCLLMNTHPARSLASIWSNLLSDRKTQLNLTQYLDIRTQK
jgi:hypothetical protein